ARLSARASARIGAGAVTLLSRRSAIYINAAHLTSIMLRALDTAEELASFMMERKPAAMVLGPGFGIGHIARAFTSQAITTADMSAFTLVLDADALSSYAEQPEELFALGARAPGRIVLTPHDGEFARLFPDLAANTKISKLERARQAAALSHCLIVLKGPDTVIAAPDGQAVINSNGTAYLATAGSGDVLAGMIAGL